MTVREEEIYKYLKRRIEVLEHLKYFESAGSVPYLMYELRSSELQSILDQFFPEVSRRKDLTCK